MPVKILPKHVTINVGPTLGDSTVVETETGEQIDNICGMSVELKPDKPPRILISLVGAILAVRGDADYAVEERDLRAIAKFNGFSLVPENFQLQDDHPDFVDRIQGFARTGGGAGFGQGGRVGFSSQPFVPQFVADQIDQRIDALKLHPEALGSVESALKDLKLSLFGPTKSETER